MVTGEKPDEQVDWSEVSETAVHDRCGNPVSFDPSIRSEGDRSELSDEDGPYYSAVCETCDEDLLKFEIESAPSISAESFGEAIADLVDGGLSHIVSIVTPLREAMDALALSIFGVRASELPEWTQELWQLESRHAEIGLRGRARRRLASLRKLDRRWYRLQWRVLQRREIGVRDV